MGPKWNLWNEFRICGRCNWCQMLPNFQEQENCLFSFKSIPWLKTFLAVSFSFPVLREEDRLGFFYNQKGFYSIGMIEAMT